MNRIVRAVVAALLMLSAPALVATVAAHTARSSCEAVVITQTPAAHPAYIYRGTHDNPGTLVHGPVGNGTYAVAAGAVLVEWPAWDANGEAPGNGNNYRELTIEPCEPEVTPTPTPTPTPEPTQPPPTSTPTPSVPPTPSPTPSERPTPTPSTPPIPCEFQIFPGENPDCPIPTGPPNPTAPPPPETDTASMGGGMFVLNMDSGQAFALVVLIVVMAVSFGLSLYRTARRIR